MREVQASDAKTHLPQLLDDVERGETIVITRHGRAVARLVPVTSNKTARAKMPDVTARLQKVFGRKVISDKAMKEILDDNRGNF